MKIPELIRYEPVERSFILSMLEYSRRQRRRSVKGLEADLDEFLDICYKSGLAIVPRGLIDAMAKFIDQQRRGHGGKTLSS